MGMCICVYVASSASYATLSLSGTQQAMKAQRNTYKEADGNKTWVKIFTPQVGIPMLGDIYYTIYYKIYSHAIISAA